MREGELRFSGKSEAWKKRSRIQRRQGGELPNSRKFFAVAIAAFTTFALAQQPPRAGDILQQQAPKEPLPVSPSTAPVLPQVTPPKPALPPTTRINVAVKDFRFSGNTV